MAVRRRTKISAGFLLVVIAGGLLGWWSSVEERNWMAQMRAQAEKIDPHLIQRKSYAGYADIGELRRLFDQGVNVEMGALSNLGYYYKSLRYRTREDDATIFRIFKSLSERGSRDAMCELAHLYLIGHGTPTNLAESAAWYRKAHEAKHPHGTYGLAHAYRDGLGVAVDMPRAVELYKLAAQKGIGDAACELGEIYERGLLGKVDVAEAIHWHRKSLQARINRWGCREKSEAALKRLERPADQGR